jgi:hypothetical protein
MTKIIHIFITVVLFSIIASSLSAYTVAFNLKTKKFHSLSCKWAKKCTVNCINMDKSEAVKRGGIACKVCEGREFFHFHAIEHFKFDFLSNLTPSSIRERVR